MPTGQTSEAFRETIEMNVKYRIGQVKWQALDFALSLGSLIASARIEPQHDPGRMLKIRRALPLRSLLTISIRLPSIVATY